VPVVLNPAPAHPLEPEMLALVDYLIPNETELYLLSGCKSIPNAIAYFQALGIKTLIVTLGEQGVIVVDRGVQTSMPAFRVKAVDTTAAGDAFIGAFSVALMEGRPLMEAVTWGSAAGAIAVTRMGAQPSLPDRAELLQFLKDHAQNETARFAQL
jgi:ribokinase